METRSQALSSFALCLVFQWGLIAVELRHACLHTYHVPVPARLANQGAPRVCLSKHSSRVQWDYSATNPVFGLCTSDLNSQLLFASLPFSPFLCFLFLVCCWASPQNGDHVILQPLQCPNKRQASGNAAYHSPSPGIQSPHHINQMC